MWTYLGGHYFPPGPHINLVCLVIATSPFPAQLVILHIFFSSVPSSPPLSLSEVPIHDCVLFIFVPLVTSTVPGTS